MTRHEAYQLVSVAGNVAITQLVDRPALGVHVKMPLVRLIMALVGRDTATKSRVSPSESLALLVMVKLFERAEQAGSWKKWVNWLEENAELRYPDVGLYNGIE